MALLNYVRLILITLWLGAALFFSIVVAPAAFGVLRSFDLPNASEIAGTIVTRALSVINITGFIVGVFLLLTVIVLRSTEMGRTAFLLETLSVVSLAVTTGIGNWLIAARMRALRIAMQVSIDHVPLDDPRRVAFQNLHGYSVGALSIAMIAALVIIVLLARGVRS